MAGVLLVHAIGGGDLGYALGRKFDGVVDFVGDPAAVGVERRPLRKVFDGLTESGAEVDAVALVATVNRDRSGLEEPYVVYARTLAARLCDGDGLFGRRFPRERVRVVEVAQPTMRDCVVPVGRELAALRPDECLVTYGTGSFALGAGSLMAALEANVRTTLVPVDDVPAAYRPAEALDSSDRLRDWALRHRFWDELAELDPENATLWRLLAARQRADVSSATAMKQTGEIPPGLTLGLLGKLGELWPAVQAAFFERVARGEAIDQSLLRAWYAEQLAARLRKEHADLPAPVHAEITKLVHRLTNGNADRDGGPGGAALIRSVRQQLRPWMNGSCAAMLRDERLEDLYRAAATHRAHLSEAETAAWPLPATIVEQAEVWENGDLVRNAVKARGTTAWPVLGSGDVLVLMCVGRPGPDPDEADRQAQEGLQRVIQWAATYRDALPRRGRVRLRLLASAESAEWAAAWATWARTRLANVGGEVKVVVPLPTEAGSMPEVRRTILAALESAGTPTGLSGSSSLRDVDETMLVINPGKAVINHGMVAAGIDWSLRAACTLRVVELGRKRGIDPIVSDGGRVLRRLGPDSLLARLAAAAVRRLDLRTAWRLLGHGSAVLDGVRAAADRLHRDLYTAPPPTTGFAPRCALARQRLTLVGHALADEPWSACYMAVEALRPGLFGWDTRTRGSDAAQDGPRDPATRWQQVKAGSPALRELERIRDASPYAHLLDRIRQQKEKKEERQGGRDGQRAGRRAEPPRGVRELLNRATADLRVPASAGADPEQDQLLLRRYERLCAELDRLAAAGADGKSAQGPDAMATPARVSGGAPGYPALTTADRTADTGSRSTAVAEEHS